MEFYVKRLEGVKSIIRHKGISEEEKNLLKKQYRINQGVNIFGKVFPLAGIFILYKKGFFDKGSPFLIKEIGSFLSAIGLNLLINHYGSEYMWSQCRDIVRKYAIEKEKEFYNLKSLPKIPEHLMAPEMFYDQKEAQKYTNCTRIIEVQSDMAY